MQAILGLVFFLLWNLARRLPESVAASLLQVSLANGDILCGAVIVWGGSDFARLATVYIECLTDLLIRRQSSLLQSNRSRLDVRRRAWL